MPIDPRSERELISGGDTRLHHHLEDRVTNEILQQLAKVNTVTGSYPVSTADDFIVADCSSGPVTVTLLKARNGKEIEIVVGSSSHSVTVTPASGDTIMGQSSAVLTTEGTAIRFKATTSNWMVI